MNDNMTNDTMSSLIWQKLRQNAEAVCEKRRWETKFLNFWDI